MNNIKKIFFFKLCLFFVLFFGMFSSLFYYNALSIEILEKKINIKYQELVDITKRTHGYYINANETIRNSGVYKEDNNVGVIVNKTGKVKVLSPAISLLYQSLSEVMNKKYIWTVAIFEKIHDVDDEYTGNAYYKLLRDNYIKINYESKNDTLMLDRIVELEGLNETYKGFHNDDIRITDVYKENLSNEKIYSVIYPIYLNSNLVSVIIFDIKDGWNDSLVNDFSNKKWRYITEAKGFDWATFNIKIPYTLNNASLTVSIDIFKLLAISFYITSVIYVFATFLYRFYLRIHHVQCNDRMTGFLRRDFIENKLKRVEKAFFLIIDIDYFKLVNDNYGHDVGDQVIKVVTQRIKESIRNHDIAIRWGGEEFVIIFYQMDFNSFKNKAEMIRARIENERIEDMDITISIGGSEQQESELAFEAIKRADRALYQSKKMGRNRVTLDRNKYNA